MIPSALFYLSTDLTIALDRHRILTSVLLLKDIPWGTLLEPSPPPPLQRCHQLTFPMVSHQTSRHNPPVSCYHSKRVSLKKSLLESAKDSRIDENFAKLIVVCKRADHPPSSNGCEHFSHRSSSQARCVVAHTTRHFYACHSGPCQASHASCSSSPSQHEVYPSAFPWNRSPII
ncbi:hypothetical protein BDN71DRAFT_1263754 [Pleurotus eryngii]|uniref:Uncharacterized protein n=1 Tax=Pleurotus eryngii TaxID=5323 RepID=A0A9P6AAB7_PLEER|nr:hypothetical protein BDN71DRAFT_1263754 [Pleurotus eryngii]